VPGARTHEVTALLLAWRDGDEQALQVLLPLVHRELRQLAQRRMAGERPGHLLQPTALVNEVYMRLVDIRQVRWQDRSHFFAMTACLMRRILVDAARAQKNRKRGGAFQRVTLDLDQLATPEVRVDVIAVDTALQAMAAQFPRKATVVELRFFGGLSVEETAEALKVSPETVSRDWKFAKSWLLRALSPAARVSPDC
jgi:RNA polymerase sigma-70 factor (ECF subfamily)